jgi:hypothetical protein
MRTTAAEVRGIIEVDGSIIGTDEELSPFIAAASSLVDACCTGTAGPDPVYSDGQLKAIETWLAAHVYLTRDPQASSEGADGLSTGYNLSAQVGLQNSHYGQMALRLDTNGGLAKLDGQINKGVRAQKVKGYWLGSSCT